jgi:hypothetical protein
MWAKRAIAANVASEPPDMYMRGMPRQFSYVLCTMLLSHAFTRSAAAADHRCKLGNNTGIDRVDAETATRLVCYELETRNVAPSSSFELDVGKLGARVVLILREIPRRGEPTEQRTVMASIEETPSAATQFADSILATVRVREGELPGGPFAADRTRSFGAALGTYLSMPFNVAVPPSLGGELSLRFARDPFVVLLRGRGGGVGGSFRLSNAGLEGGIRWQRGMRHAFYAGGAFGVSYVALRADNNRSASNAGLMGSIEAGAWFWRSETISVELGARVDLPLFSTDLGYPAAISLTAGFIMF